MIVSIETAKISALRLIAAQLIEQAAEFGVELVISGDRRLRSTFIRFIEFAKAELTKAAKEASEAIKEVTGCDLTERSVELFENVVSATLYLTSVTLRVFHPVWKLASSKQALNFYFDMLIQIILCIAWTLLFLYDSACLAIESGRVVRNWYDSSRAVVIEVYQSANSEASSVEEAIVLIALDVEPRISFAATKLESLVWQLDRDYHECLIAARRYADCFIQHSYKGIICRSLG